jgi:hypothetical protein
MWASINNMVLFEWFFLGQIVKSLVIRPIQPSMTLLTRTLNLGMARARFCSIVAHCPKDFCSLASISRQTSKRQCRTQHACRMHAISDASALAQRLRARDATSSSPCQNGDDAFCALWRGSAEKGGSDTGAFLDLFKTSEVFLMSQMRLFARVAL